MDETMKEINELIAECDENANSGRISMEARVGFTQAKATALLAKVIAIAIEEASKE